MSVRFLFIVLLLASHACTNGQNTKMANYDIHTKTSADKLRAAILEANDLFQTYTNTSPKAIDLFILESMSQLKHNKITELKSKPEAYLMLPSKKLTKADSLEIVESFKNRLPRGATLVTLDSLGNALSYATGFEKLSKGKHTKITSKVRTDLKKKQTGNQTIFLRDAEDTQVLQLAMKDYNSRNKVIDPNTQFRYFLWLNFFYQYFKVDESSPSGVKQRWLIDFSVIDASNLKIPKDFKFTLRRPLHLKTLFNRTGYESEWGFDASGKYNLFIPRKDDYYAQKWKYVILNISNQLTLDDQTFLQMTLVVNYLKDRHGEDVIKKLINWYKDSNEELLFIVSFFRETYNIKTTINKLNQDYLNWLEEKKE